VDANEWLAETLPDLAGDDGLAFLVDVVAGVVRGLAGAVDGLEGDQVVRLAREQMARFAAVEVEGTGIALRVPSAARVGTRFVLIAVPAGVNLVLGAVVPVPRTPDAMDVFVRVLASAATAGFLPPAPSSVPGGQGAPAIAGFATYLPRARTGGASN
jgi:hypothetical protein